MSLLIRCFRKDDLDKILHIETNTFQNAWPKRSFEYMQKKNPELFLVAIQKGEVIGYIIGEVRKIMFSKVSPLINVGHILNIAVESKHRRSCVGSQLLENIEQRFKEKKANIVSLEVRESNKIARNFYREKGFKETGKLRAYYLDEDAVIMRKSLRGLK